MTTDVKIRITKAASRALSIASFAVGVWSLPLAAVCIAFETGLNGYALLASSMAIGVALIMSPRFNPLHRDNQ